MLTKNVYLLYPAGYSGNYVNWAICASDADLAKDTVLDPINSHTTRELGGAGTSHLHQRVPTHMSISEHMIWVAHNRPLEKKIYVIFTHSMNMSETLGYICSYDPDPVLVIIHDDNDPDVRTYGNLNAIGKWPTYMHTRQTLTNFRIQNKHFKLDKYKVETDYNFFEASSDTKLRNAIASKDFEWLVELSPLNDKTATQYSLELKALKLWFDTRHSLQPHELPKSVHLVCDDLPYDCIHQLSCADVAGVEFPNTLQKILNSCSDRFCTTHVREFHQRYIDAQQNLEWFPSIKHWRLTGELTEFLTGNCYVEAFVIREIFEKIGYREYTDIQHERWKNFYTKIAGPDWPLCEYEYDYVDLPEFVKHELINDFNYDFDQKLIRNKKFANWKNLSLKEINKIFLDSQQR
jgi:hypothetical protein